jgi:TATA-binding protein-associated factor
LISKIYAFLRHPIATVRLAVVQALLTLITVPVLPRGDWLNEEPASLLLENLLLEEREDVRAMSFAAFTAAMQEIERQGKGEKCDILTWYELTMTPIGLALDERSFFHQGKRRLGHNIDQHMIKGDISLVSTESVLQNRVATAKALAPLLDSASSVSNGVEGESDFADIWHRRPTAWTVSARTWVLEVLSK